MHAPRKGCLFSVEVRVRAISVLFTLAVLLLCGLVGFPVEFDCCDNCSRVAWLVAVK